MPAERHPVFLWLVRKLEPCLPQPTFSWFNGGTDSLDHSCLPYPRPVGSIGEESLEQEWFESTCNAGDPGLIPGSGRSTGEGIGYPLQYSWASLVAQLVKNPLAMWETWVRSLAWEDLLEKGKAAHSSILAWRIPWTIRKGLDTTKRLSRS